VCVCVCVLQILMRTLRAAAAPPASGAVLPLVHVWLYQSSTCHCRVFLCAADPDADPEGSGSTTSFRRGLSPCVFVPWEGVAASPLNLPAKEMDFWLTG
jgi:hypothetical protein